MAILNTSQMLDVARSRPKAIAEELTRFGVLAGKANDGNISAAEVTELDTVLTKVEAFVDELRDVETYIGS